ncbi:MAG TPA: hypothetical protein VKG44_06815 [Candidatus Baltobacteraceae bacterium]|nr:hypothetical protein [Candidatus Baltobacteraceae bacterium]
MLFAALVAQSTLPVWLGPRVSRIDLVLLVVLWFAFRSGVRRGAIFGALAGLCEDALGGSALSWSCATAIIGGLAGAARRTPLAESPPFLIAGVALATLLRLGLFEAFRQAEQGGAPFSLHAALWQSGATAATCALLFLVARRAGGAPWRA